MLLLLAGVLLFFVVAPLAFTYFLYRYITRKSLHKALRYLAFVPLLLFVYSVWTAFYPAEAFYKEDYKEVTKLTFPREAKFLYKYASFPDHFGDYTSVFLIQIEPAEYNRLLHHLPDAGFATTNNGPRHSPQTQMALAKANSQISIEFVEEAEGGKSWYVALFNDQRTILIGRHSW